MPGKGRKRALELLHVAHPGIVRMKSLARGYMWWPSMNDDIELGVKQCTTCQSSRKMPPVAPLHQWVRSDKPWSRIHIDYAGPLDVSADDRFSLEVVGSTCHDFLNSCSHD